MRELPEELIIREAGEADIPAIATLGAQFYREAGWADVAAWDDASIRHTLCHMIANPDGIVLVLVRKGVICGMAGGLVHPLYFNHAHKTGQELFWWVSPDERIGTGSALLEALEQAARDRGAESWAMIALDKVRPEAVGAMYRRRGYRASEHSFIKRLAA